MGLTIVLIVISVVFWIAFASVAGMMAVCRGRSGAFFFYLSLILPPITLIILAVMQPVQYQPGQIVRVTTRIRMDDGTVIPARHVAKIIEVSVIDNTRVLRILDPKGAPRWIAATAVRLSA